MKIAILSFYNGHIFRGVETWTYELASRLAKHNDVTVYQNGPINDNPTYKVISVGINIDLSRKTSSVPFFNYSALKVKEFTKKVIKQIDPDTDVVIPTNGQWQSLLLKFWTVKNKKKLIICGHSGPGLDDMINLFTFPDVFVALTNFQKSWVQKINPFIRVSKISNGVDLNRFKKSGKVMDFGLPKPIFLSVAAFDSWKRLDLAIRAVSHLKDGSLLLVGTGKEEDKLLALGNKLLPNRFKTISFPYEKMPDIYLSADVFTYPTVPWESFGIVILEAMAAGLPVVAAKDPIRKEIIGDSGLLVNPTHTKEYANALEKSLKINWLNKPRQQAEKFSWDKITKEYEKLFLDITK